MQENLGLKDDQIVRKLNVDDGDAEAITKALQNIIRKIAESTDKLSAAEELGTTANETNSTMKGVKDTVSSISGNISEQATDTIQQLRQIDEITDDLINNSGEAISIMRKVDEISTIKLNRIFYSLQSE